MDKYLKILKQYWGYDCFRELQGDIIKSVSERKDTLGLMPTGGGKSITFQVPTMCMDGICLVITPLIALMKDQVDGLKKRKIKAAAIYSGMTREEIIRTLENCIYGKYKFLYISPERLSTELFISQLQHLNVCLVAVDESHCISQWGYDFRPSYLRISEIRDHLPDVPILALTATATPEVVKDIQQRLKFPRENVFQKSFERKNLAYVVRNAEDKFYNLLKILTNVQGSAIVYVRDRKKTKEIADFLNEKGFSAEHFHAGISNDSKDAKQTRWKTNQTRVIVSTNAFGMGIDKPDVRLVIHLDLPDSLEAYFQEAGRAGRDGKKAYAVLLYNKSDSTKLKKRLSDTFPAKDRITLTYDKLGNYFELGVGSGEGAVFAFNLQDFCHKFKLPILPTYHSLKNLEHAGYLELTDELDNASRVLFTIKRDELYSFQLKNPELDKLMQLLLRSYTGLFTDYAHINEEVLAGRLNSTRQKVYDQLVLLSKQGFIHYIPAKKTPFIIYTCNRVEADRVKLSKEAYDDRKGRYEKKITEMLRYATDENVCRSQILLQYFGQKDSKPCGHCDVCLEKKKGQIQNKDFNEIKVCIEDLLKEQPRNISELLQVMPHKEDQVLLVIRFLFDNGLIKQQDNILVWVG
ncbi:MAG: RecQ family ATP-dependent DNA helicase [Paludibacteraceae bacterium]|nr:RecQ family ATP-dependent DNA helicase [Paludibacteraceae bacterium]